MLHLIRRLAPSSFALLLGAALALPASPAVTPLPVALPPDFSLKDFGTDLEPACNAVYLNESIGTGFFYPAGPGVEVSDDLHTTLAVNEAICAFDLAYYNPASTNTNAVVTFYADTPADGFRGAIVAGPYALHGLPPGVNAFHIEVGGGIVTPHVWMGVAFEDAASGLLTFDPPSLGASHDAVWQTPPDAPINFGGQPPANLFLGLYSSPSTPARPATWGNLKARYR